jgi:hypothetical protein
VIQGHAADTLSKAAALTERLARPQHTAQTRWRFLAPYGQPPRNRGAHRKAPLLAVTLGEVPVRYVWRFPRATSIGCHIKPSGYAKSEDYPLAKPAPRNFYHSS